ncbi:MAG: GNAT family N-acetyltransferase [Thermoanaerobaculia bacterium]
MSSDDTLETARLALRPFAGSDFEEFFRSCISDPAVMGFFHAYRDPEPEGERRARAIRDFVRHFEAGAREFGYVCWALRVKADLALGEGSFVGWCGVLTPALDHGRWGPELAFMLARSAQGAGLATEAASLVVQDAWRRYGLSSLHAVVDTPNIASRRVLERVGFALHGPVEVYGSKDMLLYTAAKPSGLPGRDTPAESQ